MMPERIGMHKVSNISQGLVNRKGEILYYHKLMKTSIKSIFNHRKHAVADFKRDLYCMAEYVLFPSGKLLRPIIMLLACEAVGGDATKIIEAAVGSEFGHTASLVHDDIIDKADKRRGKESLNQLFGIENSILCGDLLIFESFLSLARTSNYRIEDRYVVEALKVVSRSCIDMSLGQNIEQKFVYNMNLSPEQYIEIIRYKTASFIRGVAESGAILGGGNEAMIDALRTYGESIGIAFQITDDILDFTGNPKRINKPAGYDFKNGILTLPLILAMEKMDQDQRRELTELFYSQGGRSQFRRLQQKVAENGGLELAADIAIFYATYGKNALSMLPRSRAREDLAVIADFCALRGGGWWGENHEM